MPKWLKITLKIVSGLVVLVVILVAGLSSYVYFNKARVIKIVNEQLRKTVNGVILIGDMDPQFVKGFPDVSLQLKNVLIRDKRYAMHKHTLLNAHEFEIVVNTRQLMSGVIAIQRISLNKAAIDLYTDSTGYSNTSVFASTSAKPKTKEEENSSTQLRKIDLNDISLRIDDEKSNKLFDFAVDQLSGQLAYPDTGVTANLQLKLTTKSMAFNLKNGSFLKNKAIDADLAVGYNNKTGLITARSPRFDIGGDDFVLDARFATAGAAPSFAFHLTCDDLRWRNAAALLSNNITLKLNQFNISKPMGVKAIISGSFAGGGDPYLYITAAVKKSTVTVPGSQLTDCSFDGIFTNSHDKRKPMGDDNSLIKLINLKANYGDVPFRIDTGSIVNLNHPIATGNLKADFPLTALNSMMDRNTMHFSKGRGVIDLHYQGDVIDFNITKPTIVGDINVKNAAIKHIPSGLLFEQTSAYLHFTKTDLLLKNIAAQVGHSKVKVNARVNNFMNFYYTAPEKIVFNCAIHSPQLYLGEFVGFLGSTPSTEKSGNSGNLVKQFSTVLNKCQAALTVRADEVHYNKFLATNVKADLRTRPGGVSFKNVGLRTAGGALVMNGDIKQSRSANHININTTITHVNVRDFFASFNSFGLTDLTHENLRGSLSAQTNINLAINNKAALIPQSVNGNLKINLKDGALLNFKGLQGVVKLAFPFRDFKTIRIPNLDADFLVKGDKIEIRPMQFSSSILNADIAGTYGLTNGTNIAFDVPLRNPKKDSTITDQELLQKKRYKGIVLHLLAKADENGKIKIGFNKDRKTDDEN